jgi:minor histocompatibility antigen H13
MALGTLSKLSNVYSGAAFDCFAGRRSYLPFAAIINTSNLSLVLSTTVDTSTFDRSPASAQLATLPRTSRPPPPSPTATYMAEADPGLMAQLLGRAAYEFAQMQPMLPVYLHLIVSALFPIYTGAHASLSRPSSAAKPPKKKRDATSDDHTHDDDDEEEEEQENIMEGLSPTDALLMPLFAGCALASLYFLLKWMKDPALLNKILNAYFAFFGVFSVSKLVTDVLDIGHSLIFPHRYTLGGTLYHVNAVEEKAEPVAGLNVKDKLPFPSPLPGFLARIPLSNGVRKWLWADRAMPGNKWTLRLYLHRALAGKFKIGPHGLVGVATGLITVAYFNLVDKPWYLTNLLGFGFSYGALQLMSPTTFATGSLILGALFFYDIYFVFYT